MFPHLFPNCHCNTGSVNTVKCCTVHCVLLWPCLGYNELISVFSKDNFKQEKPVIVLLQECVCGCVYDTLWNLEFPSSWCGTTIASMTKHTKGLALPMSGVRHEQKRADLVCEWDATGHLVDVLLRVELIPLVKAPAQLWVENQWVSAWQQVSFVRGVLWVQWCTRGNLPSQTERPPTCSWMGNKKSWHTHHRMLTKCCITRLLY